MPLPDESRPGRASELIRRFQAAVDNTGEKPLTVSSSFAAPAAPPRARVSGQQKEEEKGALRGKGVVEAKKDEPLFFRSAGLSEKPAVPVEQQGRKNAQEAFSDVKEAPKVEEVARELEVDATKKEEDVEEPSAKADEPALEPSTTTQDSPAHPASPPHPVVTQPSLDVPPPVPVPGSTDLLSSPASPEPAEEDGEQTSLKTREGLSRPTSPAADEAALRVPPTTDDSSPPPTPTPAPAHPSTSTPSRPPRASRTSPTTSRASPAPSPASTPRRTSTSPTTSRLTAPTASSLAKSVSRPNTATSSSSTGSPGQSPSRTRAGASPRLSSGGGGGASMSRQGSGGAGAGTSSPMRKSLSSSSNSSSGGGVAKMGSGMTRSTSSSTSSSSAASPSTSPRLGRNGTPLRMARTGRVGLAGARSTRPPPLSTPPTSSTQNPQEKGEEDNIPVFPGPAAGFLGPGTSRPIGKIGVPVVRNERGEVEAVGREEVEREGEEARRRMEGKGQGEEEKGE